MSFRCWSVPLLATLTLWTVTACGAAIGEVEPEEEVAMRVEGISPAVLELLPEQITMERLDEGRRSFAVCTVCHGLDARGTALGPPLRGTEWIHITGRPEEIIEVVRTGVDQPQEYPIPMPVMGGGAFEEQELESLSWYVYALGQSEP
jgi:mono/diheme cytochrome c family protein